jgi:hypothetical protein
MRKGAVGALSLHRRRPGGDVEGCAGRGPGAPPQDFEKDRVPGRQNNVCILMEVETEPNGLVARDTRPGHESTYFSDRSGRLSVKV